MLVEKTTLGLASALIACPSVTPDDAGAQTILIKHLEPLGFQCETLMYGQAPQAVTNLWAIRRNHAHNPDAPVLVFSGHTDVVTAGAFNDWTSPPFTPSERLGKLYGRGATDMKSSIAALVMACKKFIAQHPKHYADIALLITSDEEGVAKYGTFKVCEELQRRGQKIDYCIIGEPSSERQLGDTIKNGRRGVLNGTLTVHGLQGHTAYPHLARNPIHLLAPALNELVNMQWDETTDFFPATQWQVANIHAGTGTWNIIPNDIVMDFNFRFSPQSTPEQLKERFVFILEKHNLDYHLQWQQVGQPFLTRPGELVDAMQASILEQTGLHANLATSGGTSDGRFLATICPQVVEFGPVNTSIHQVDEHIDICDLEPLTHIYLGVLERLCLQKS